MALLVAPYEAEISAEVFSVTADVRMVNVADVAPEGTVTLAGTCAAAVLPLDNSTVVPLEGAAAFKVTVPVDEIPPTTVVGLRVTELRFSKLTVNPADCFVPYVPEMFATVALVTVEVETPKVAVKLPAGMRTLGGT